MKANPALSQYTARPRSSQDGGISTDKHNVTTGTLVRMKLELTSNRILLLLSKAKAFSRSILSCGGDYQHDSIRILQFNAPPSHETDTAPLIADPQEQKKRHPDQRLLRWRGSTTEVDAKIQKRPPAARLQAPRTHHGPSHTLHQPPPTVTAH